MGYSAQLQLFNLVIMFFFIYIYIYSSIVSHSMSEKLFFFGPWQTWQVKFKRFQMLFILRFKVKSCLTLCRPFIGNKLAAEQNEMLSFHLSKRVKNLRMQLETSYLIWQLKTTNDKINPAIYRSWAPLTSIWSCKMSGKYRHSIV